MKNFAALMAVVCGLTGCSRAPPAPPSPPPPPPSAAVQPAAPPALTSGIESGDFDTTVRPQDDFYHYVNGKWLARTEIPADKGRIGAFELLDDAAQSELRGLIEGVQRAPNASDPDQQKIADLYASFMDEPRLEQLQLQPLTAELARVDALQDRREIPALIAHFNEIGVTAPYSPQVHQDAHDSSQYVFDLQQDGLGLPDRDYYLDGKLAAMRQQYGQHVERMLQLMGDAQAATDARSIVALETSLARLQWTRVQNRDPIKTYNKYTFAQLARLAPDYDWTSYLKESGVMERAGSVVVSQPSYLHGFNQLLQRTPLPVWKIYFRWHLVSDYAPYLSKRFVDEHFAFYGKVLEGIPQNLPRWRRGVRLVDRSIGEGLGRLYVAQYFPPASKARMQQLVQNLLAAYRADVATLDWMSPPTRQKAAEKLAKLTTKIGYPVKWRDYTALSFDKQDLVGNVTRANTFEYNRNLHKLGQPVDRTEWDMTPQTVNAYYDPEHNEIVFPAAILQPPFFNPKADDAVNYGGIGGVIGHEISHGFDDQGSQYDADGNLLNPPGWFTPADLRNFKARTHALVAQYSAYQPVKGYFINGELTLGENIADNSGIAIAHKAYRLSLQGGSAPVIDNLTGDQRFFIGWAQVWRGKARENLMILLLKSDPHSPEQIRGTVPEMNQAAFDAAFDIKPGDHMYLPPDKRVTLW